MDNTLTVILLTILLQRSNEFITKIMEIKYNLYYCFTNKI